MSEIERQATRAWGSGTSAVAAYDFFTFTLPAGTPHSSAPIASSSLDVHLDDTFQNADVSMELSHADPAEGFLYNDRNKKRRL